jgi:hypothetical protein
VPHNFAAEIILKLLVDFSIKREENFISNRNYDLFTLSNITESFQAKTASTADGFNSILINLNLSTNPYHLIF